MSIQRYVVGFMFNHERDRVALIIKERPDWQKGLLNGIGGKIEKGEDASTAMTREFHEEAGIPDTKWDAFLTLENAPGDENKWIVFFYTLVGDLKDVQTMTDEYVSVYDVHNLPHNCVPNLKWLVPLAALDEVHGELRMKEEQ